MTAFLEVGSCIVVLAAIAIFLGVFKYVSEGVRFKDEFFGLRSMAVAATLGFVFACSLIMFWYMIGIRLEARIQ